MPQWPDGKPRNSAAYTVAEETWIKKNYPDTRWSYQDLVPECNRLFHGGKPIRTWGAIRTRAQLLGAFREGGGNSRNVFSKMETDLRRIQTVKSELERNALYRGQRYEDV